MSKLYRAFIALAALAAFAVLPATASAVNSATVLKVTNGVHEGPEAVGSLIVGPSINDPYNQLTDPNGTPILSCAAFTLTGTLTRNDHTEIAANITSATFAGTPGVNTTGHCAHPSGRVHINANPTTNGLPWCLQSKSTGATDSFTVRGNSCDKAARPIRSTFQFTTGLGTVHCEFERSEAIPGTYTTGTTPTLTIHKVKFTRVGTNTACPAEWFLDLRMQLHTDLPEGKTGELAIVKAT